jgi:hypothetical protein
MKLVIVLLLLCFESSLCLSLSSSKSSAGAIGPSSGSPDKHAYHEAAAILEELGTIPQIALTRADTPVS